MKVKFGTFIYFKSYGTAYMDLGSTFILLYKCVT